MEEVPCRTSCAPLAYASLSLFYQARKKSTKIKFLGPETARWGGGLPREGVVAENFVPALETLSSLGFEERNPGCPGNFAGMSRTPGGVQKVCAKKLRAHFSFPILIGLEAKNRLAFQGRHGNTCVVRWSLRPVIFGVDICIMSICFLKQVIFAVGSIPFFREETGT